MFFKIGALKKFAKFTGKHLCQSLFFNNLKKRLWHRKNTLHNPFQATDLFLYYPLKTSVDQWHKMGQQNLLIRKKLHKFLLVSLKDFEFKFAKQNFEISFYKVSTESKFFTMKIFYVKNVKHF